MSDVKQVGHHVFCFNKPANGGESLILHTKMFREDADLFLNQELTLHSYMNSASFSLFNAVLTPNILRTLADELEAAINNCQ